MKASISIKHKLILFVQASLISLLLFMPEQCLMAFGAEQSSQPQLIFSDCEAKQGDSFTVTVSLKNNPGITSMDFYLTYDNEALELVSQKNGVLLGGQINSQKISDYPYYCGWVNALQTKDCVKDGLLLTLRFRVKKDAENGQYTVSALDEKATAYNVNLDERVFSVKSGWISVGKDDQNGETDNPSTQPSVPGSTDEPGNRPEPDKNNPEINPLIAKVQAMSVTITSKSYNKKKGVFTIKYKKSNSKVKIPKYQIWRSTKKNSGYRKVLTTSKLSYKDQKLGKKKQNFYYKVRGLRKIDGKTYYTKWSKKVKVRVNN